MTAALAAAAGLGIVAVVFAILWLRARATVAAAERRRAETEDKHQRDTRRADERVGSLEAQLSQLQERLRGLEGRTWLTDFPADAVFRLVARDEADLDGERHGFGLVRDESGHLAPFVSERRMSHLEAGDWFAAVRGQLVKLDPSEIDVGTTPGTPQSAPPPPTSAPASPARPAPRGVEDATVPAGDVPARQGVTPAPPRRPQAPAHDADATVLGSTGEPPSLEETAERTVFLSPTRDAQPEDPNAGLPYLEITAGPDEGKTFPLPFTGATIGREATNVVPLADGGASRVHCRIDYRRNAFVLRDNDSTNGTLCNDEPVRERELAFGDVVQVADTKLRYTCEGYELRTSDTTGAIAAFERCLARQPDFVPAIKNLAFLLEKDVARKKDAQPLWDRLAKLERG